MLGIITGGSLAIVGVVEGSTPTYDAYGNQTGTSSSSLTPIGFGVLAGERRHALVGGILLGIKSSSNFELHPQGVAVGERKGAPLAW